ncbi:MAG: type IV pilus modification protein PilV [Thiofilum sp.]|uniref:type IV pilus modification protein PilV n=1 Tax=Thiofilum sp. TaxID=2212733 RepID=UPI0025F209F1|nr:type IV pilus modification protein PilV [Thiofilum sp.]MBK8453293.1 type IV pilus modification protein PilV [Thiofilum sp.]
MYANHGQQQGFSLLEVLIAVLILSIGLMGLASMQVANLKVIHNSSQKQQATLLLNDLAARVRNNFIGAKAGQYVTNLVSCDTAPSNTCRSASCTPSEIAALDLYQVMCGAGSGSVGIKSSLTKGKLVITCVGGCSEALNLSIQWQERINKKNDVNTSNNEDDDAEHDSQQGSEFKPFELSMQIVVRSL